MPRRLNCGAGSATISGNMPKLNAPETPEVETTEGAFRAMVAAALGALFEIDDRVEIHTHSGGVFAGLVEDCNIVGLLVRIHETEKLHFVSFAGIESSEIFEDEAPDDGDGQKHDDDDETRETVEQNDAAEAAADVTPITRVA